MVELNMAEFKMSAIIKLSENEWVWVMIDLIWIRVLCKMAESKMAVFKMAAIIKVRQNEWREDSFLQIVGTNLGKC